MLPLAITHLQPDNTGYLILFSLYLLPNLCYLIAVTLQLLPYTSYLLHVILYLLPDTCYLINYFWTLFKLDYWKLRKTILQSVLEAKKLEKQNCTSHQLKLHYLPFKIWCSHYFFVHNISNFNHGINILIFLDSAKAGMLKNVQNHF